MNKSPTFLIWDREGVPPKGEWIPVLWRSYGGGSEQAYSMPRILDEKDDALRARFLAWIYDLGEVRIEGKRLIDHLELRPGFSYWWMTLVAEKSNAFRSLQVLDVLKMFAVEDLAGAHSVNTIVLESDAEPLAEAFRMWCKNAGLAFEWRPGRESGKTASWIERLYRSMPLQAAVAVAQYVWQRCSFGRKNEDRNEAEGAGITFIDYLIHLDQRALTTGRYASNFWTDLIDVLDRSGLKVNWLHLYMKHKAVESAGQARELIARFNESGKGRQFHACLDCTLSVSVIPAMLADYGRLVRLNRKLKGIKDCFRPAASKLDFWPLYRRDWRNSMTGPNAIWNCLVLNLFERTFSKLPRQKLGIYLQENQAWEMAMIHAWRAAGHGRLIGFSHTTVRYWDVRYFFDPRSYSRDDGIELPMPDRIALNGPAAVKAFRKGGYPEDRMVEVESLRYLYLADQPNTKVKTEDNPGVLRVLILGDYLSDATRQQMQWTETAAQSLPPDTRYVVKPHPFYAIESGDYPSLKMTVTHSPLMELLADFDIVFTSSITSAAVDAYCAGVPVVTVLDGNSFNMSPLRGLEGVVYVTNAAELAEALRTVHDRARAAAEPYFCLDRGLPRWRMLLGLDPV